MENFDEMQDRVDALMYVTRLILDDPKKSTLNPDIRSYILDIATSMTTEADRLNNICKNLVN